jgi:N-acetylglucosaminyldiphosphoundecaprenol N-acetyl-beta-D-mannosaminyltransferase
LTRWEAGRAPIAFWVIALTRQSTKRAILAGRWVHGRLDSPTLGLERRESDLGLTRRVDVLGIGVSATSMEAALDEVARWIDDGEQHYVCVTGVHGVMESQRDPDLIRIHNESGLTIPDGAPMLWAGRMAGAAEMRRMRGPDFMLALCERAAERGWGSFFYGGAEGTPETLVRRLTERFPSLRVCGTYSPPFRELTPEEDEEIVERINASGADLVWVGLSTPKQERWMDAVSGRVRAPALLGVGAAFDIHAGLVPEAPAWIRPTGFEWAYRLYRNPRRLWRRYLRNNPSFVARILRHPPRLRRNGEGGAR